MMFSAIATIAGFAALASSLPVNGTTTTPKSTETVIVPTISRYHINTGAVEYGVSSGWIHRRQGDPDEYSTLSTFEIPAKYAGKQCELRFTLGDYDVLEGSKQFDVFLSQKPATTSATSWPSGNLRDQHLGRMKVETRPGAAICVDEHPAPHAPFLCQEGIFAGELAPVDQVNIYWDNAVTGPRIVILDA